VTKGAARGKAVPEAKPAQQWMDWFQRLFAFNMNA
jgi:hypothetical protein